MPSNGSNLAITNPLVLYRSLLATNRIQPDPAQHRLALHLQKVYDRLIDYEPTVEYSDRLKQLSRTVNDVPRSPPGAAESRGGRFGTKFIWTSLLAQREKRNSLALTRVLTSHEAALTMQSPRGLMLHGEVGTGKSMLVDLFHDSLPTRKKRRWHFNTFMLETFSRLEHLRRSQYISSMQGSGQQDEFSLLRLSRDLIQTSPIIFLDEFQLPDRAASKILSNLLTSFFQLGGVLIATSNRMPEELAKAAGMEFSRPVSRLSRLGWTLGMHGNVGRDDGPGQMGEFAAFLEVLRGRCEVWEMEGKRDYRRMGVEEDDLVRVETENSSASAKVTATIRRGIASSLTSTTDADTEPATLSEIALPKHYLITPPPTATPSEISSHTAILEHTLRTLTSTDPLQPIPWTPATLTVYGRPLHILTQTHGVALFTFASLCGTSLGPADYITLASTYHTICITDVPVLGFLQKNEARRFITLLDAMYEVRCRLLITATAGPGSFLFPTTPTTSILPEEGLQSDAVHPETFSEIHQDLTSPFRPNVSSYTSSSPSPSTFSSLPSDALEDDPPNRARQSGSSFTDERRLGVEGAKAPDFSNVGGLTGEDEKFAVKRAESRVWEMCSGRWWERYSTEEQWWRPLPAESRHWERPSSAVPAASAALAEIGSKTDNMVLDKDREGEGKDAIFAHGASPFRTSSDMPPKIQWTHVWGTARWGRRAGAWGKGVEGLEEREMEKKKAESEHGDEKKI